jgi:hypothetical protein
MARILCPQRTWEELRKTSAGRPAPPGSGVSQRAEHTPGAVSVGPIVSDPTEKEWNVEVGCRGVEKGNSGPNSSSGPS